MALKVHVLQTLLMFNIAIVNNELFLCVHYNYRANKFIFFFSAPVYITWCVFQYFFGRAQYAKA